MENIFQKEVTKDKIIVETWEGHGYFLKEDIFCLGYYKTSNLEI